MNEVINEVHHILENNYSLSENFGKYSKIYMMTTENIKGYLEHYNLKSKQVLTVAGSGDQMLNSYLMGAENVTCFDVNPLAFYQVKLKKAAVSTLSYQEFLSFFFPEYGHFLEPQIFKKISANLDLETKNFFQFLYENYNNQELFQRLYFPFVPKLEQMKRMNAYLEKQNYEKLSYILKEKEATFLHSNITNLRENLNQNHYDFILLSNISDSIQDIWPNDSLKNFKRLIHSLSKSLNKDGHIQVGYIYDYYFNRDSKVFPNANLRSSIFTEDEFPSLSVQSYHFHSESDEIITYQKRKKKS